DEAQAQTDTKADAPAQAADAAAGAPPQAHAWWNMVQEQFKQAVGSAVNGDAMAKMGEAGKTMAADAAAMFAGAKPATKKAAAPVKKAAKSAAKPAVKRARTAKKSSTA
ncbi:MAG TPA: hypothetical protein VIT92_03270, partial [Burkholderiaceae bacterium]